MAAVLTNVSIKAEKSWIYLGLCLIFWTKASLGHLFTFTFKWIPLLYLSYYFVVSDVSFHFFLLYSTIVSQKRTLSIKQAGKKRSKTTKRKLWPHFPAPKHELQTWALSEDLQKKKVEEKLSGLCSISLCLKWFNVKGGKMTAHPSLWTRELRNGKFPETAVHGKRLSSPLLL